MYSFSNNISLIIQDLLFLMFDIFFNLIIIPNNIIKNNLMYNKINIFHKDIIESTTTRHFYQNFNFILINKLKQIRKYFLI